MIRKVLAMIMSIITIMNIIIISTNASEDYIPSETFNSQVLVLGNFKYYTKTYNLNKLNTLMTECQIQMENAHLMAEAARALGYDENHPIITLAQTEWNIANSSYTMYQKEYNNWMTKIDEYPEATHIWLYLKNLGYSDMTCAAILGNIMAEVGGNTLKIQPYLYGKMYYGICQWHIVFYRNVVGTDLMTQCNFLRDTIRYEFDTFGFKYKTNFNYEAFVALTDVQQAALAFAMCYERCDPVYYLVRQSNALSAYKYYVG